MPLEIRELIIKATVDDNIATESNSGDGSQSTEPLHNQQENLVNLCVEKVLEILKEKSER